MPIGQDAMTKEEYDRWDKGLKPLKVKRVPRPEPAFPKINDHLKFSDIPMGEFGGLIDFSMRRIQNEEGINFIGYDVTVLLKPKRGVGRPSKDEEEKELPPRILKGWMIEGDFEKLKRQRV